MLAENPCHILYEFAFKFRPKFGYRNNYNVIGSRLFFFCVGVGVCFQPLVVALVLQNRNVLQENSIPPSAIQNCVIL